MGRHVSGGLLLYIDHFVEEIKTSLSIKRDGRRSKDPPHLNWFYFMVQIKCYNSKGLFIVMLTGMNHLSISSHSKFWPIPLHFTRFGQFY